MSLINTKFKSQYDSYLDDVVETFYNKALNEAIAYDRVSAYFDSKILSLYATGLERIFFNHGKVRFIFSQELNEKDFNLMQEGYEARANQILEDNFDIEKIVEADIEKISNLAFLIENNLVDIKIAFTKSGILHDKFGIIYDEKDNKIFFRGSNNETVASVEKNHERFEVSCSWYGEKNENFKIEESISNFEQMWNNNFPGMKIVDIPKIIKDKILSYSKGKIIVKDIDYSNAVVADIIDNQLVVKNNLDKKYNFDTDYDYKNFIKKHVLFKRDENYFFDDRITYMNIINIINSYKKSSEYNSYKFVLTLELENFLIRKNLQIDKRKELGKCIKQRDTCVLEQFNKFQIIVNQEMKRTLREKQMWDSFFITKMIKSANYSVPGAGKTSIVYGAYAYLNSFKVNEVDKMVVICPKNAFKSWKDEFYECFGNKKILNLMNIQDRAYKNPSDRIKALRFDSKNKNLILVNYSMLESVQEVLNEIIDDKTMLVFDEVHKVKAINGMWATNALKISVNARYKVIMTGTPIPNSYTDLYNQLNILFTEEYKSFFKFSVNDLKNIDNSNMNKINEAIYPFFCRTTKRDLEIPMPNQDEKVIVNMNNNERFLFAMIRHKYRSNGLAMYIRLLQAATNPKLLLSKLNIEEIGNVFDDEEQEEENIIITNEKYLDVDEFTKEEISFINQFNMTNKFWKGIDLVKQLVEKNKTVLVWAIFVDTIDKIEHELKKQNIKCKIIYGATELEEREKTIDEFKNNQFDVLITNPHTLAESVSLHKNCHDAVYFEYSFNLTHMLQSRDRINRLGLPENQYTQYYYMMLINDLVSEEDSIDLKTYNRLKEKEEIMLKSIEGNIIEPINFDVLEDIKCILNEN